MRRESFDFELWNEVCVQGMAFCELSHKMGHVGNMSEAEVEF